MKTDAKLPDYCSICHHSIEPTKIAENIIYDSHGTIRSFEIVIKCPREACSRLLIARYRRPLDRPHYSRSGSIPDFILQTLEPSEFEAPDLPQEVVNISEQFKIIYSEAAKAEHYKLSRIAGGGYRQALEYLVKDYCIYKNSENPEEVKEMFLGECINKFIDDPNIKECARLATWLGNDETHYTKKWVDTDIEDLKVLIDLTMSWIKNNILTEKYRNKMNPEKDNSNRD